MEWQGSKAQDHGKKSLKRFFYAYTFAPCQMEQTNKNWRQRWREITKKLMLESNKTVWKSHQRCVQDCMYSLLIFFFGGGGGMSDLNQVITYHHADKNQTR